MPNPESRKPERVKTVYILIGSRGSGKTYIGKLIERELGIKFLMVEPYFLEAVDSDDYKNQNDELFGKVWEKIGKDLDKYLKANKEIVFESLGVFNSFKKFLKSLEEKYEIKLIKINCRQETCLSRLEKRDVHAHTEIDKDDILKISELLGKEKYEVDLIIENENLQDKKILKKFKNIRIGI